MVVGKIMGLSAVLLLGFAGGLPALTPSVSSVTTFMTERCTGLCP